ncbi:anti-sigma factor domain-containing protein [Rothia sp. ZJ932]|uniref:anti-sigma factor domain-containing protein n=1 Tax=Rothia sp. ZJ932 TaxID=2810516 RepID=UPI00196801E4|nr:anti-sigma factor [Rothia sp. ZJ932]QRZ61660.1 anti-sigma factor [Rothia sp. ZJ932]
MSNKFLSEDAAGYALNSLGGQERATFEAALDKPTREQVRDAQEVAATIGLGVMPLAPPAYLKAQLMQQVRSTPQVKPPAREDGASLPGAEDPSLSSAHLISPLDAPVSRAQRRAQERWSGTWRALTLVAAAAALVAGSWGFTQYQQLQDTRTQLTALKQQSAGTALVDQISMAEDVSLAKGNMDGSNVSVVYSPSHNMAAIATADLPPLPEGKAYMIWLYDAEGQIVGSGTLNDGSVGQVFTEMTGQDLSQVTDFGITVEDATATAPSDKPLMLDVMAQNN